MTPSIILFPLVECRHCKRGSHYDLIFTRDPGDGRSYTAVCPGSLKVIRLTLTEFAADVSYPDETLPAAAPDPPLEPV